MKRVHAVVSVCCFFAISSMAGAVLAEEAAPGPWQVAINSNLTLTTNMYSDNWTGGEFSTLSWMAAADVRLQRQMTSSLHNRNTLKLAFGQTAVQEEDSSGERSWNSPEKSSDLIDLESMFRFTLQAFVDPFAAVRAVTQFWDAGQEDNDRYLNPLEITESAGAVRELVQQSRTAWNVRLGAAARQIVDRHTRTVAEGTGRTTYEDEFTYDGGVELVSELVTANKDEWITFESLLRVYEAVVSSENEEESSEEDGVADWRYPDINWENTLTVNLTKYIMFNLYVQTLYDREIDRDPRFKETLALGLSWTFRNYEPPADEDG